jgi:hypothetical protein
VSNTACRLDIPPGIDVGLWITFANLYVLTISLSEVDVRMKTKKGKLKWKYKKSEKRESETVSQ